MASTAGQHRCYGGGTRRQQECRRWCLNLEATEAESRQNECWGLEHPQSFSFIKFVLKSVLPPTLSYARLAASHCKPTSQWPLLRERGGV